ncbi:hypothetical protein N0V84_011290 [Fusarium piperis]|uniref:Uncharacterized protein n=1 Tax=Fusarium piperis TaxID=1435070 RepID=A0A9W8TCF2_9HYPO|nr:hypothetical protein N0V84_011290 [Fusarium piperis]
MSPEPHSPDAIPEPPGSPLESSCSQSCHSEGMSADTDNDGPKPLRRCPAPLQGRLVSFFKTLVCGLILSALGWVVTLYLARPPAIPLPVYRPLIELTKTLPSLSFAENDSYGMGEFKLNIYENCSCPSLWIRSRRRYLPENADDLWDNDLWGDIPSDLPGKLYGFDEDRMMNIAIRCEELFEGLTALETMVSRFESDINHAHQDAMDTISAIIDYLHSLYRYQLLKRHKHDSTYDGWIIEGYLNELGTSVSDSRRVLTQVQDDMLGPVANKKGSTYKRRNPRAFTTRLTYDEYTRLRLHSSVVLVSTLSHIATDVSLLLDKAQNISAELDGTHHQNRDCGVYPNQSPVGRMALNNISRTAIHNAAKAHQAVARIDALRVSLRGFWGTRQHYKEEETYLWYKRPNRKHAHLSLLGNENALVGDLWQATWTWLGLQTEFPTSMVSLASYLTQWIPARYSVRLPDLKEQHAALVKLYLDEAARGVGRYRRPNDDSTFHLNWPGDYEKFGWYHV